MKKLVYVALAAAGMFFAACQSNSYKIEGKGGGIQDGDTIFLTKDFNTGIPFDTAIVSKGEFVFEGEADSTYLCLLYCSKRNDINAALFIEAGTVKVSLSEEPGKGRVSGTEMNRKWQELNDTMLSVGGEMQKISAQMYEGKDSVTQEEQEAVMEKISALQDNMTKYIVNAAEKNIDNEFGYFVVTYFTDALIPSSEDTAEIKQRLAMLNKMPEKIQKREDVSQIIKAIEIMASTAVGETFPTFEMNDINGKKLSLSDEFKKNEITLVDFWASWCGPCRAEMPNVVKLYNECKSKGFGIIGVSLDSEDKAWKDATKELGITWPQVSDLKGWQNEIALALMVQAIPETVIVDKNGVILARGLRGEKLAKFIKDRLK